MVQAHSNGEAQHLDPTACVDDSHDQGGTTGRDQAQQAQARPGSSSDPRAALERGGIRVGRWEVRPDGPGWVVGRYNDRNSRLKEAAYGHYLGHVLRRLHNRLVADEVSCADLVAVADLEEIHTTQYATLLKVFGRPPPPSQPSGVAAVSGSPSEEAPA